MNDYLFDVDEAQYSFVRVPKLLLQHEAYVRNYNHSYYARKQAKTAGKELVTI